MRSGEDDALAQGHEGKRAATINAEAEEAAPQRRKDRELGGTRARGRNNMRVRRLRSYGCGWYCAQDKGCGSSPRADYPAAAIATIFPPR
jgi:hypothetical protein